MEIQIEKNGTKIKDVPTWFNVAPPKGKEKQWQDGYSAKELAKFVTENTEAFKALIEDIVKSISDNKTIVFKGVPEFTTPLPFSARGPRNHDLLLSSNNLVIGIESKANESFGNSVYKEINNSTSKDKKERIHWLMKTLLEKDINLDSLTKEDSIGKLKYQLFTATAGTLLEAAERNVNQCVVLVLSFYSDKVNNPNQKAFNEFVAVVCDNDKAQKTFVLENGQKITCWFKKINRSICK